MRPNRQAVNPRHIRIGGAVFPGVGTGYRPIGRLRADMTT